MKCLLTDIISIFEGMNYMEIQASVAYMSGGMVRRPAVRTTLERGEKYMPARIADAQIKKSKMKP